MLCNTAYAQDYESFCTNNTEIAVVINSEITRKKSYINEYINIINDYGKIVYERIAPSLIRVTGQKVSGGTINNALFQNNLVKVDYAKPSSHFSYQAEVAGGALVFSGKSIEADFVGNGIVATANCGVVIAQGGAIYVSANSDTDSIIGDFTNNYIFMKSDDANINKPIALGGAIYNDSTIKNIKGEFFGNYIDNVAYGSGGVIYNSGTIGDKNDSDSGIVNSSFRSNYVKGIKEVNGGAIFTTKDLNLIAKDDYTSVFSGNYTENKNIKDDNAIYVDNKNATVNFKMKNGGKFAMVDNIRGTSGYSVNITGDDIDNTTFYMLNDMHDANLSVGNTTLDTINNIVHNYALNSFALSDDIKMALDVDLTNQTMDRFTANSYGTHNGKLTIVGMNLLSDAPEGRDKTSIFFAESGLKDNIVNGVGEVPHNYQTAYTPIYKYNVSYDNREDGGYFVFDRMVSSCANPSESYNPSVLSTSVTNQAGGQAIVNETVRFSFQHADTFSQMPAFARTAYINKNRYAGVNDGVKSLFASRYDIKANTPRFNSQLEFLDKGVWVRPFTSFEKINLSNGPDVSAITYGTLVGFDSNFKEMKRGWYNVKSIYGGYNGSQMSYSGVDTTLNGGMLGLTETFYKGNFFTALTATAGANVGTSNTMYGKEDFTSLIAGIGSKSGYNFEFKNGKYILQPILFMNYSFVNTFDYTNASGVKIKSDPLHTLQINPQLKFVSNLKNGWQPYASVGVVWNVLNSSKIRANDVILPKMSVDPYVEYGVGIQRSWKERLNGFCQAIVRNGGRNGVALTFGFRWALGRDKSNL